MLLGAGIGFGWHYFADSASGRAVTAAATPLAQQDTSNPPSSNPPAQPEGPVRDVPHTRGMALDLSDEQKLALVALLTRSIADDRHPSSPRVRTLKDILVKLDAISQAAASPRVFVPPEETRNRTRRQG
jgi:hypothetical protein